MTNHVMVDIETLSTDSDAVVLTVGAVKFNPYSDEDPHSKTTWLPSLEKQLDNRRSVSDSTLEWWAKQNKEVLERALSEDGRISLDEFFKSFNKYLVGAEKVWCQGPQFDLVILEDLFKHFRHHRNWAYYQAMDSRTLFQLMPEDPRKKIEFDAHDAAEDAYVQAICVQKCLKELGL